VWLIFIFKTADAMPERFGGTCCAVLVTRGCAGSSRTVHRRRKTAGGLLAAVFGLIDWLAIPAGTRAKRIGLFHALSNVLAILGFALAFWMRYANRELAATPGIFGLEVVALVLGAVGGWLGGELVDRLGVGVDSNANLNAPNSMSSRPSRAA